MSVTANAALQISTVDGSTTPTNVAAQSGGIALYCPNSALQQDATLPASTSLLPLSFPVGVTTAVFVYIASVTCTDLIVNVGSSPFALPVPLGQGMLLYNITSAHISISSVLGGKIQYAVGG